MKNKLIKIIILIIGINCILTCCSKKSNDVIDSYDDIKPGQYNNNEKINVMESTFSLGKSDGYSWYYKQFNYKKNKKVLTNKNLSSTIWIPSPGPGGYMALLVFYLDNVFKMGWVPSGCDTIGKYEIVDKNKVRLYDFKSNYENNKNNKREIVLELKNLKNNFWYNEMLANSENSITYYPFGAESKLNKKYKLNDIDVIKLKGEYVAKTNLKIREKPTINSKTIENSNYSFQYDFPEYIDMFLKGDDFKILGRTIKKDIINNKENYWYLIKFYEYNTFKNGWVFGEYIKKYDELKEEEYKNSIEEELRKLGWEPINF
jgi:hypothetical protein